MTDDNNNDHSNQDAAHAFISARRIAFTAILQGIETRQAASRPHLVIAASALSPEQAGQDAVYTAWGLLSSGIAFLNAGAPGGLPGSMMGALSRGSLRSSPLASALGIKPPQFERMLLPVDYSTGHEAAIVQCQWFLDGLKGDIPKSRQIIEQKIREDKAQGFDAAGQDALKIQMGLSFNMLVDAYLSARAQLLDEIASL